MTVQICPKPGLAKRPQGYEDQLIQCRNEQAPTAINRLMVDKAIALGTGETLAPQERCLLMALCAHLNLEEVAAGKTAVWPGAARLCQLMGIGESTLRRLKGGLEEKGFLLRRYDHRNRPLHGGSLDLKPFLLKVPKLLACIGRIEATIKDARARHLAERADGTTELSAQPPESERAIRNHPTDSSERSLVCDFENTDSRAEGMAVLEIADSLMAGISGNPLAVARDMFGTKKAARLWDWALKRRGAEAHLALAVAAKSRTIRDPEAWFGWYATTTAQVDLEGLANAVPVQPIIEAPKDPTLQRLLDAFALRVGEGPARSYLSQARLSEKQDHVVLYPANSMAARRLTERYADDLSVAAVDAGFFRLRIAEGPQLPATADKGEGRPDKPSCELPARKASSVSPLSAKFGDLPDAMPNSAPVIPSDGRRGKFQNDSEVDHHLERQKRPEQDGRQPFRCEPDPVAMAMVDRETGLAPGDG